MPICFSDMQMFLLPRSFSVSVGGAAFWLTKTFSLLPPHQSRAWLGGKNCRRAVFLELQQAIVQDISFFFLTLQAYLMHDKRKCTVFSLQGLNHTASLLCCPASNVYMVLQPLGMAGVTETWLFCLISPGKSIPVDLCGEIQAEEWTSSLRSSWWMQGRP